MNTDKKLNLLIFGATRNTGYYVMQQALDTGHSVTAIIRNPEKFGFKHANLKVVKGDALQLNTFENEVAGKDAIISTLGSTSLRRPTYVCSQGVTNMMQAMKKVGLKRIICVSALGLEANPKMGTGTRVMVKILSWILKQPYADLNRMEAAVKASAINWTIMHPPRLMNNPATGNYRVSIGDNLADATEIGRPDLAHYIVGHVQDTETFQKTVEVAY
jgi:putative NADH-flavin reductase